MSIFLTKFNTVWWVTAIYAIIFATFMVLENKSSQSTFARIFVSSLFPVAGVVIYFMFGRFSHHNKLYRQELRSKLLAESQIKDVVEKQEEWYEQLKQSGELCVKLAGWVSNIFSNHLSSQFPKRVISIS